VRIWALARRAGSSLQFKEDELDLNLWVRRGRYGVKNFLVASDGVKISPSMSRRPV
jgi:phage terminase large subunit